MDGFLAAMLLLGLASGVHCLGMCGGVVTAFSASRRVLFRGELVARQLAFNAGRIATYAAAGALAGAAGSLGGYASFALPAQTLLYGLASVLLVLVGLHVGGFAGPLARLEALAAPLWQRVQPHAARLLSARGAPSAFAAGALWGTLPCGLVYGALGAAIFAGGPAGGAAAMAAFGLGTLPYLLGAGLAAAKLRFIASRRVGRLATAAVLLGFGGWGLAHASGAIDAVNRTWLCF